MGLTAEKVARRYKVTREDQDQFAYHSHRKALAAIRDGKFREEIVPVSTVLFQQKDGGPLLRKEIVFDTDDGPRADTTVEALAKLKPAFDAKGTVTAGNSSQMSDGAAVAIVVSEKVLKELGVEPMARFLGFAVAGVAPEIMGIGPIAAIPKLLKRLRMKLNRRRPGRAERGVRRAVPPRDPGAVARPRQGERERRRDRPRPPARVHRAPS